MRRTLLTASVALAMTIGGAITFTTPAHASDAPGVLCNLNQNTWLRDQPHGNVIRTLSAGRGFRFHSHYFDGYRIWLFGHGAEAPAQDGWIPGVNVYNCNM